MDLELSELERLKCEWRDDGDLNFNLLQLGCSDKIAVVPKQAKDTLNGTHISTLPTGLPPVLQDLHTRTENYLTLPEKLPIHNAKNAQRFIARKTNPSSLYNVSFCPLQSTLQVDRDPTTGELLGFKEFEEGRCLESSKLVRWSESDCIKSEVNLATPVNGDKPGSKLVRLENTGSTSKNSLSLLRQPGPPSEAVRGSSTNYPFWPGGMDEPTLEAMKTKIDGEIDIDFENNLLTIPPGFQNGMTFEPKVEDVVIQEKTKNNPINDHVHGTAVGKTLNTLKLTDIMLADDDHLIFDEEEKKEIKETDAQSKEDTDKASSKNESETSIELARSDSLEKLLPPKKHEDIIQTKGVSTWKPTSDEPKEEWAVKVDISTPVEDFYKKVPAPAKQWPFELDVFQKQAVLHLENHESVFVAAHTSAGKTVVAEYAIALSLRHLTRTIYTSPIKALSNQKFRDFRHTFVDVGLLTGDVQIRPEGSCLIMTTEILRSMLYNGSDVIRDLEWVIFDEVHYINDSERGVVWEEVLIMLPVHVKIILLSATVPNTMQFAGWVGRIKRKKIYVISTLKRPVPLEHFLYTGNSNKTSNELFMIVDAKKQFSQKGYNAAIDAKKQRENKALAGYGAKGSRGGGSKSDKPVYLSVVEMLRKKEQLPVVAFTFSKKRCDDNASSLSSLDLTTSSEKSEIHVFMKKCLERLKAPDRKLPQVLNMTELLKRGIAVHHSGILPILKEVVEMLFQRGLVKLLFATETFAMGVNMPARTVLFDSITKHDGTQRRTLLPGEYIQMAGRAGRRGLDTTGMVIILCKGDVPEMSDLHKMMLGTPTQLESQFRLTYTMILNLLRVEELRVEDMMKRSFSESKVRKDAEVHREKMRSTSKKLREFKDLPCFMCTDLESYYHTCKEVRTLTKELQRVIASHPTGVKYLSAGRVVVVQTEYHKNALGVILSSSTAGKERTFKTLVICEQEKKSQSDIKHTDQQTLSLHVQPIIIEKLFQPEGACGQVVLDLKGCDIETISVHTIKVSAEKIVDDVKKRQIPRFRNDPPGQSTSIATQELLRLAETNPDGLEKIDPVKDLHLRDIDLVEKFQRLSSLDSLVQQFSCLNCTNLMEHFSHLCEKMKLKEDLEHFKYLLSDQSLDLLPEYHQRIQVLRELRHLDNNNAIQLKGRVACEINNHELVITELVFQNILSPLPAAEIAALLSCIVFQERRCSEPELTESLKEGVDRIRAEATRIGEIQKDKGMDMPIEDFVEQFRFGLTQVVYEWSRGMPFIEITKLTDVSEGSIVRTIQRLDETCRDVRNAARIIGDPSLFRKMEETSQLIKRDIVFAASLYTQ